ncbi:MAG: SOS response-associated peptidase [Myxococcota bacterium]
MCGRYVLKASPAELQKVFHLEHVPEALPPRFNIAPLQAAPVILDAAPGELTVARWGLLPHWAKETKVASRMINARAETLAKKTVFRELLPRHRCLVPCDGFYEWKRSGRAREPHFIHAKSGELLAMAGLWSRWRSPDGLDVITFTIITSAANELVRSLHDRMPVFLDEEGRRRWLSGPAYDLAALEQLLRPWHGAPLTEYAVTPHVNKVAFDDPSCLEPAHTVQLSLL